MASTLKLSNIKAADETASITIADSTGAVTHSGAVTHNSDLIANDIKTDTIAEKTSANGVTSVPEPNMIPSTADLAEAIAVTRTILPARPPLVEPFIVMTSLLAPEMNVLPVASVTPV